MRPFNVPRSIRAGMPAIAFAVAAAFGAAGAPVYAQGAPAFHRGAHGMADDGMAIIHLRQKLNLSTDQSAALDAIIASAKTQGAALRTAAQPTIAQITAELAKAQPSLQTIAQLRDSLQGPREALRKSTRDQLIGFYGTLNATQQQVVIDALRKMAARKAAFAASHAAP